MIHTQLLFLAFFYLGSITGAMQSPPQIQLSLTPAPSPIAISLATEHEKKQYADK